MTRIRRRTLFRNPVLHCALAACLVALRAEAASGAGPKSEPLFRAASQQPIESDGAGVRLYPIGFSRNGRFAALKHVSGYRGECTEEEYPSGFYLVIHDLVSDKLLDELWVDELLSGQRERDSGSTPGGPPELPVVTAADADALLRRHKIESDSYRLVETAPDGTFKVSGTGFRLEDESPCSDEGGKGESDECQDEQLYETVLARTGTGSKVITRFATGLMRRQRRLGAVVINRDSSRMAVVYVTEQIHEGNAIADIRVVGAHLASGFKAAH